MNETEYCNECRMFHPIDEFKKDKRNTHRSGCTYICKAVDSIRRGIKTSRHRLPKNHWPCSECGEIQPDSLYRFNKRGWRKQPCNICRERKL